MKVTIDPYAGFCFGVERAIQAAETNLTYDDTLFTLGMIVHNEEENKRLKEKGLRTITYENFVNLKQSLVLFRAHGEPPSSYKIACRNRTRVIDATCPVVKRLQSQVAKSYTEMVSKCGAVVIYGKKNHPEVIGLVGQTQDEAIVVSSVDEVNMIDFPPIIRLFAQTTMGTDEYMHIKLAVQKKLKELYPDAEIDFKSYNTICGQVSGREKKIRSFASSYDLIIFVAGKYSSNGKLLYEISRVSNPLTYYVSKVTEVQRDWFKGVESVGITGATSTPDWLLKEVAQTIERF